MRFRADADRDVASMAASIFGMIGGGLICTSGEASSMAWCYERAVDRLGSRIAAGFNRIRPWDPDGLGIRVSDALNALAGELPPGAAVATLGDAAIEGAAVMALVAGTTDAAPSEDASPEGDAS
jgi:hypothetical protein